MYFIILGILQNFTPKMLQIVFPGHYRFQILKSHAIAVPFPPPQKKCSALVTEL
jgi:hypothetical protein